MAKSRKTSGAKLRKLNWRLLLQGEHCYLDPGDECYFADSYECRQRSGIKPLIILLKRRDRATTLRVARQLSVALPLEWKKSYTFVPMPPAAGTSSGLMHMVERLGVKDVRKLLSQQEDTLSSHNGWRPSPKQRQQLLLLDKRLSVRKPEVVVVVDDVLTTGSHFRAAKMVIRQKWPGIRVIGLFVARACSRVSGPCCFSAANDLCSRNEAFFFSP
jgi:predicted amidophosphoribosyltransferase